MTLVMDGVRRTQALRSQVSAMTMPMPVVSPLVPARQPRLAVKRVHAATARANAGVRYITGMDGIRRAVPAVPSPRQVLGNLEAAVPAGPGRAGRRPMEAIMARGAAASGPVFTETAVAAEELPQIDGGSWPALRLPRIRWQRPAIAFGLVATALVASTAAVRVIATPRTVTAHAETVQVAQTPAPAPSVAQAAPAAVAPKASGLQRILDDFVAAHGNQFGIVVKDLKTGETASVNPGRQMTSASLYKLFVAQRIYQRIDLGQLDYGKAAGGGTGRTIDDCLTIMINISDNACGRALGAILGWGSQDAALRAEGYKETSLQTPQQTSAEDVAMLFGRLYEGTLVSPNSTQRFLGLLKDQRVNNRLPQGLPGGTIIAHKTGDLDGVVHDAGIVYGPKTDYLVTMMSGPWNTPGNAPAMFAELSRSLWKYFEQ